MGVSPPNPRPPNAAERIFGATERGGATTERRGAIFWRMPQLPAPLFSATDERENSKKYLAGAPPNAVGRFIFTRIGDKANM